MVEVRPFSFFGVSEELASILNRTDHIDKTVKLRVIISEPAYIIERCERRSVIILGKRWPMGSISYRAAALQITVPYSLVQQIRWISENQMRLWESRLMLLEFCRPKIFSVITLCMILSMTFQR